MMFSGLTRQAVPRGRTCVISRTSLGELGTQPGKNVVCDFREIRTYMLSLIVTYVLLISSLMRWQHNYGAI